MSDTPLPIPGPDAGDLHFFAPWQAKAFALTVHLHEKGAFSWTEWAEALSERIGSDRPAPDAQSPQAHAEAYWRDWLDALLGLVQVKGLAEAALIEEAARTWQRAAEATPHGTPIAYEAGLEH